MFRSLSRGLLLVAGAQALETEVGIYCRLLDVALQGATFQPVLEDVNITSKVHKPLIGDVNVSVSHLLIDRAQVRKCDASVDHRGRFNVAVTELSVDLKELDWAYAQQHGLKVYDHGRATANTSMSFNVTIDMEQERHQMVAFKIGTLKVHLGAERHRWLTGALEKMTNFMTPLVSQVVHLAAHKGLDDVMQNIYQNGACAFATGALKSTDMAEFHFTSYEPFKVHVPVLGDMNISVNSTSIVLPTSMQCEKLSFNGTELAAHVHNVPFSMSFVWAYQKANSSFWHNEGTGSVAVVAGTVLDVDVMQPKATHIKVELPTLKVKLHAEAHTWMYNALTSVMTPLIRESMQLFGGKLLGHVVEKCLADPTCPQVKPSVIAVETARGEVAIMV